jgi:hypothetical protein
MPALTPCATELRQRCASLGITCGYDVLPWKGPDLAEHA